MLTKNETLGDSWQLDYACPSCDDANTPLPTHELKTHTKNETLGDSCEAQRAEPHCAIYVANTTSGGSGSEVSY